jgi:pilus assembly protein Flp/PilA
VRHHSRAPVVALDDASRGGRTVRLDAVRHTLRPRESGQGLAEYALILGLIAVLAIAALTFMGGSINDMLSDLGNAL